MNDKPVIVLIHGHGVNSSIWSRIYDELATDYTLVKPDFSALSNHETVEAYAEELYSRLQSSQLTSCVLVGHSMGGYIALAFAEKHPEMVRGLVLFNSTAFADDEAKKQGRLKAIATLEESGSPAFIGETVPKMFGNDFNDQHAADVKAYADTFSELPSEALTTGLKAMAARPDRTSVLQHASFPVLIVAGGQDQIVPLEKSQELFKQIPKAKTVVLDKAGHLGMIESPEEAVQVLRGFVSGLA